MMPAAIVCLVAAAPAPQTPVQALRAQYEWGYAGAEGSAKGTLALQVEPATGKLVLELHGMGERLLFLQGDREHGYRLLIPRDEVDTSAPTLAALPVPFLPELGSPERLLRLLTTGEGTGVRVLRRDAQGPRKLEAEGKDRKSKPYTVWLTRSRWDPYVP